MDDPLFESKERKKTPFFIYWIYGLMMFIPGIIFIIFLLVYIITNPSEIKDAGDVFVLIILALPILMGLDYLNLARKKKSNRMTDLSIIIGSIPLLVLLLFYLPLSLINEFRKATSFSGNEPIYNYIPTAFFIFLMASILFLIIGSFTKKDNEQ